MTTKLVDLSTLPIEDILIALEAAEAAGRQGLRYDIGLALFRADPHKVIEGSHPLSFHDHPEHGGVTITGYDENRRVEAIKGLRELYARTTMEAVAQLRTLHLDHIDLSGGNATEAEMVKANWEKFGFTAEVYGFGRSRTAASHTLHLKQSCVGPWVA